LQGWNDAPSYWEQALDANPPNLLRNGDWIRNKPLGAIAACKSPGSTSI